MSESKLRLAVTEFYKGLKNSNALSRDRTYCTKFHQNRSKTGPLKRIRASINTFLDTTPPARDETG